MAARSVSLGAMFNWIAEAFSLFARRFGTFFGAGVITLLVGLAASAPLMVVFLGNMMDAYRAVAAGLPPPAQPMQNLPLFFAMYALTLVLSLVVMPPLLIGWLRLYREADLGAPTSPLDVLRPYTDLPLWARSIGYALIAMVIAVALFVVFGALLALLGGGLMASAMHAGQAMPHAPSGLMVLLILFCIPAVLILQLLFLVGFAELGLRDTPVLRALGLAAAATGKNLPGLVVLVFALMVLLLIGAIGIGLVVGIAVMVLMMASKALGFAAYFVALLLVDSVVYALLFGGVYAAWRGMLGEDARVDAGDTVSA